MTIWKEIRITDIKNEINELDVTNMLSSGTIVEEKAYKAVEIESSQETVKLLARLEAGRTELLEFEKEYYKNIPDVDFG